MRLYFVTSHDGIDSQRRLTFDRSDNQVIWTRTWANRWWIWLIVAIMGIIITSSCYLFFNERLMKKGNSNSNSCSYYKYFWVYY